MNWPPKFLVLLLLSTTGGCGPRETVAPKETLRIERGRFAVWATFVGSLEAERQEAVFSRISEPTTLLWMVPEGTLVQAGEEVAKFDAAPLEVSMAEAERELITAKAGVNRITRGEHPLRLMAVRNDLKNLEIDAARALHVWRESAPLGEEGLLSKAEIDDLKNRADALEESVRNMRTRLKLMEEVIHPSERGDAEAQRDAAQRRLTLLHEQMASTTLRAGIDGMALRLPLHIGGEYRTLREGDKVFRNQRFMQIADLTTLTATFEVEEDQISQIRKGNHTRIIPSSFPNQDLEAEVSQIAAVALSTPGNPAWKKTFRVTASLKESHPQLRSGMTVRVMILTYSDEDALLVHRSHVAWEDNLPRILVQKPEGETWESIQILAGNETHFSIQPGDVEGKQILPPLLP